MRVFAVWFNMLSSDDRARWPKELLSDRRVIHFWDEEKTLGRFYLPRHNVPYYDEALWDAWILYSADGTWAEEPPPPISWGNTIVRTREQLGRDFKKLLAQPAASQAPATSLTPKQQVVVDYLVSRCGKGLNVSGVSLAMRMVGSGYGGKDRYTIGMYLKEHTELHGVLRTYGWETVTLDPHEKGIALVLSRAEREQKPAPSLEELADRLQESPRTIESGLRMLEWFGIIRPEPSAGGAGYRMAAERYLNWEGAMRITFLNHRVEIEGSDPFDVSGALEFPGLANEKNPAWRGKNITIRSSSPYSGEPIRVGIKDGRVTTLDPETTRVFPGGDWAPGMLFASQEEVAAWLKLRPDVPHRKTLGLHEYLEKPRSGESR